MNLGNDIQLQNFRPTQEIQRGGAARQHVIKCIACLRVVGYPPGSHRQQNIAFLDAGFRGRRAWPYHLDNENRIDRVYRHPYPASTHLPQCFEVLDEPLDRFHRQGEGSVPKLRGRLMTHRKDPSLLIKQRRSWQRFLPGWMVYAKEGDRKNLAGIRVFPLHQPARQRRLARQTERVAPLELERVTQKWRGAPLRNITRSLEECEARYGIVCQESKLFAGSERGTRRIRTNHRDAYESTVLQIERLSRHTISPLLYRSKADLTSCRFANQGKGQCGHY